MSMLADDPVADVLIVGAGSAGCALAGRLSEDTHLEVVLVEAGEHSSYPWVQIPIGYFKTVGNPRFDWRFTTEPDAATADRRIAWPRGKGVGGTSLINGMLYLRGHRNDYDQWEALGNPGWNWDTALHYFKRSQGRTSARGVTIGNDGPLRVSEVGRDRLSDAFIAAAGACGIPRTEDFNTGDNSGAGYFQMTTHRGRRVSSARAYLEAAAGRRNLRVLTAHHATRVLIERGRAVGVEFLGHGQARVIRARHQVVLAAGAIQSPQLLQLSGIGDPQVLERHGIGVVVAAPGVGRNLQDHVQVRPAYRCRGASTLNTIAHSRLRSAAAFMQYMLTRRGALKDGVYRAGAFCGMDAPAGWPNVQIHFGLVSFDRPHQPPHAFPGITLSACILRPHSRGSIEIASADPLRPPLIRHGYLHDPRDATLAVAMVRRMREIAATAPLAGLIEREHVPGSDCRTDAQIENWVRRHAVSIFHPVGTCAMGPDSDPLAVLDARLRVKGVPGLRVVDGSAMPRIVSGNTNAPIILMAERVADWMREELRSTSAA